MKIITIDSMNVMFREQPPTLEWMQQYLGGYIEVVTLSDGGQLVVNEEGKLYNLYINKHASLVNQSMGNGDYIAGNAIHLYEGGKLT